MARSASGEIGQVGQHITRSNLSIQPTITVRPGFSVNVIVTKDMMVPPYPDPPTARGRAQECRRRQSSPGDERPRARRAPRPCGACRRVCLRPCLPARVAPSLELDAQPAARALLGLAAGSRPRGIARRVPGARQRECARAGSAVPAARCASGQTHRGREGRRRLHQRRDAQRQRRSPRARSPSPIPAAGRCRTTSDAAPFQEASSSWRRICRRAFATRARSALCPSPSSEER